MSLLGTIAVILSVLPGTALFVQDGDLPLGCDMRLLDTDAVRDTLDIIKYRITTRQAVEPLLILSPYSDPDILGRIAIDDSQTIDAREMAANAILDQLYVADTYFQACAEHYLKILTSSPERSLRLKGYIGEATLEFHRFGSEEQPREGSSRLLRLRYYSSRERDPQLRRLLDRLADSDISELIGSAAWSPELASRKPYRQFDSLPHPPQDLAEKPEPPILDAWNRYRAAVALNDSLFGPEEEGTSPIAARSYESVEFENLDTLSLIGFLSRYRATLPARGQDEPAPEAVHDFFLELATNHQDPYLRSLALSALALGPNTQAADFFLDRLANDESSLVRLSAAELLKHYCSDSGTRRRIIAYFRPEEDARVRLRMLVALVWPFQDNPPPDVLAFLLGRLQDQTDPAILEFAVFVLGNARVSNASAALTRLSAKADDIILRVRITEALSRIGIDRRIKTLPEH